MNPINIAVIPGDGIGREVIPEGIRALEAAGSKHGVTFEWTEFDWSCETYHKTGRMMPEHFDVVVGSNLFGDILSDLGPACAGTIAIAPSANINPEKIFPSMFEPVHGSAPEIAGQGIANPIGTVWAGTMMMQHLGYPMIHDTLMEAIETILREGGNLTRDMGGHTSTQEMGRAIVAAIVATH